MRKIILIMVLVWACVIKTDASVNLNQFSIQSGFLQEGKLKPSTSGPTTFNVDFWFSQVGSSNNTVKATVIYREGNTDTELMTGLWRFEGDWITSGSTVWQLYSISAVLPAGKTAGKIYLKYETGTGSTLAATFYSSTSYDIYTASTNPNPNPDPGPRLEDNSVGVPPAFTAPEVGSVPLYEYVSGNRRRLTTVYYLSSSYPEFTYNGIVGYVFTSAKTGTVPLMRYSHPSNGNSYYTITPTTTSGYNYEGIVCFVYDNQITNSFPVYENYSSSLGSFHRYSISNELFSSYIFGGAKFYILQNQPPPTVDYSTYLTTINSFVFVSGGKHKLNQSTYQGSDWRHEGANFRGYTVQVPGTVPIYELLPNAENDIYYSHQTTDHYWVKNKGVVFYAHKTQVPGTIPIYDYTNQYYMDHFASPSYNIPDPYWIRHGISFYAFPLN